MFFFSNTFLLYTRSVPKSFVIKIIFEKFTYVIYNEEYNLFIFFLFTNDKSYKNINTNDSIEICCKTYLFSAFIGKSI